MVAGPCNCFNLLGSGQVIRAGYSTVFRHAQDSSRLPLNVDAQSQVIRRDDDLADKGANMIERFAPGRLVGQATV